MEYVAAMLDPFGFDEVKESSKALGVQGSTLAEAQGVRAAARP